jgi:hypothetical protein
MAHCARSRGEAGAVELLRQAVEVEGSQLAFAKRHALDRTHLIRVLQGKRTLSDKFLKTSRASKGVYHRPVMTRGLPPPWSVDELEACFVVIDSAGQKLAYVYFEEELL